MASSDELRQFQGVLRTRMGGAFVGERAVFRGHDLHRDLADMDWIELLLFGITGRRFGAAQIQLIHAIWLGTSYPDARIWNNRVAALAGSTRSSPALAMSAALAVSEARVYGGQAGLQAFRFLLATRQRLLAGEPLAEVVAGHARIYGYGRPINAHDERIGWLMAKAGALGLAQGAHIQLAFAVERLLLQRHAHLQINYAALHAACLADMGLNEQEYQLLRVPLFLAGMPPCYLEALERPAGATFPIPVDALRYTGPAQRAWQDPPRDPLEGPPCA